MAFEGNQILVPGLKAAADYTAVGNQYKFVYLSAINVVTLCTAVTQHAIGVLQNRPDTGETADVCCLGFTKVQGDADLAVGDFVGPSTDGQAQVAVATQFPCGQVIEDNAVAGGYATIFVNCAGATVVA
jgi:hypothetical protein